MQLSHREPAVLHGLVAVGAIHRLAVEKYRHASLNVESDKHIALRNYGKAISELRSSIAWSQSELDASVVMLASLLFFCFDMLRGDGTVVSSRHLSSHYMTRKTYSK
jgi:hypothetical protein